VSGRTARGFLAVEPPTVTHNDLVAYVSGGRPAPGQLRVRGSSLWAGLSDERLASRCVGVS